MVLQRVRTTSPLWTHHRRRIPQHRQLRRQPQTRHDPSRPLHYAARLSRMEGEAAVLRPALRVLPAALKQKGVDPRKRGDASSSRQMLPNLPPSTTSGEDHAHAQAQIEADARINSQATRTTRQRTGRTS